MITLIKDATTIGQSENITVVKAQDEGNPIHSFQVSLNGSPTAVTVRIEASIDDTDFSCIAEHTLSAAELANNSALFHIANKPVPVLRANITKLDGGVSPQVSIYYFKGK
jgi:hypothetical protein